MTDLNTTNTLSNPLNRWITYGIWLMITLIYIPIPAVPGTLITFTLFILSLYSMNYNGLQERWFLYTGVPL